MTFFIHQGGDGDGITIISGNIMYAQSSNIYPFDRIKDTYAWISVVAHHFQFTPTASYPTPGAKPPKHRRAVQRTQEPSKMAA